MQDHWLRGGFPDSVLALDDEENFAWRLDFISTFLERDIPSLGFFMLAPLLERLWRLLAHFHGQLVYYSKIAEAIDISVPTLKKYLAILEQTYMIRFLPPCEINLKKRLIKSRRVISVIAASCMHCLTLRPTTSFWDTLIAELHGRVYAIVFLSITTGIQYLYNC